MEIGKQYRVFASNKKSFIEECVWAKGEFKDETYQAVTISEVMRNGSYSVSYTHSPSPRDRTRSRMPSSA